jgi:hypothetical protein
MARRRLRARVNWVTRWSGLALTLFLTEGFIVGLFERELHVFDCRFGTLNIGYHRLTIQMRGYFGPDFDHWEYWRLPLWWPLLLTATLTILAWYRHLNRPPAAGHCARCRYDLSGLQPGSPCPECAARPKG